MAARALSMLGVWTFSYAIAAGFSVFLLDTPYPNALSI